MTIQLRICRNEFVFDDQEELQMFLDLNEDGKEEFSPVDTVLNKEKSMKYWVTFGELIASFQANILMTTEL